MTRELRVHRIAPGATVQDRGRAGYRAFGVSQGGAADRLALAEGAARYASAPDGLVPWRERSEHFKRNCIARIPPTELPHG